MKTANVIARVPADVKLDAEAVLSSLGISVSSLINMLYRQIINTKTVPFPLVPIQQESLDKDVVACILRGIADDEAGRTVDAMGMVEELRAELRK